MSEERIMKLEEKQGRIDITLTKIEQTLESISVNIEKAIQTRDEVIILKEKCNSAEIKLKEHIDKDDEIHASQNDKIFQYGMIASGLSASISILIPFIIK